MNAWLHTSVSVHLLESLWIVGWMFAVQRPANDIRWVLCMIAVCALSLGLKLHRIQRYVDDKEVTTTIGTRSVINCETAPISSRSSLLVRQTVGQFQV